MHRSGFVNIVGLPNVGKSSLINFLIEEKLSIITSKAQTTRQNIRGFLHSKDYQIILVDTPGYIDSPAYQLQLHMNSYIELALEEGDVLLLVVDKYNKLSAEHPLIGQIRKFLGPCILVINKIDQSTPEEVKALDEYYKGILNNIVRMIPITISHHIGREEVIREILNYLPEHPPFFDKEEFTDRNLRFLAAEIIREKVFENCQKEIPYSSEVVVNTYMEKEDGSALVEATIYVERESQRNILIGHHGEKIKQISIAARKNLEEITNGRIHLFIFVKVLENWRNREIILKKLGYPSRNDIKK